MYSNFCANLLRNQFQICSVILFRYTHELQVVSGSIVDKCDQMHTTSATAIAIANMKIKLKIRW